MSEPAAAGVVERVGRAPWRVDEFTSQQPASEPPYRDAVAGWRYELLWSDAHIRMWRFTREAPK